MKATLCRSSISISLFLPSQLKYNRKSSLFSAVWGYCAAVLKELCIMKSNVSSFVCVFVNLSMWVPVCLISMCVCGWVDLCAIVEQAEPCIGLGRILTQTVCSGKTSMRRNCLRRSTCMCKICEQETDADKYDMKGGSQKRKKKREKRQNKAGI